MLNRVQFMRRSTTARFLQIVIVFVFALFLWSIANPTDVQANVNNEPVKSGKLNARDPVALNAAATADQELTLTEKISIHGGVAAAGVGLRGSGEGDILITRIPFGAVVAKAYLYWATLGDSNQFETINLNGKIINGEHIATSDDTCWGVSNNFVYRADVSGLINGNGIYRISGLPSDLVGSGNDSQGASLVVLYAGPFYRYPLRTIILHDGAVTLDFDVNSYTDSITGFSRDDPLTEAHITYLVGDGQSEWMNSDVRINDTSIFPNSFIGGDGDHWGTLTFEITALVGDDSLTTTITNELEEDDTVDCLLWAGTVFSVTQPTPEYVQTYLPIIGSE